MPVVEAGQGPEALVALARTGVADPTPAALALWNQSRGVVPRDSAAPTDRFAQDAETTLVRVPRGAFFKADAPSWSAEQNARIILTNLRLRVVTATGDTYQVLPGDLGSFTYDGANNMIVAMADGDYPLVLRGETPSDTAALHQLYDALTAVSTYQRTSQAVLTPEAAGALPRSASAVPVARTLNGTGGLDEEAHYRLSVPVERPDDNDTFSGPTPARVTVTNRRVMVEAGQKMAQVSLADLDFAPGKTRLIEGSDRDILRLETASDYPILMKMPAQSRERTRALLADLRDMNASLLRALRAPAPTAAPVTPPVTPPVAPALPGAPAAPEASAAQQAPSAAVPVTPRPPAKAPLHR